MSIRSSRRAWSRFAGAALVLLLAASHGAPVRAVTLPVMAELRIEVASMAAVVFLGSGTVTVNGSGAGGHLGSLALAADLVGGTTVVPQTDPAAFPIVGVQFQLANASGTIAESGGGTLGGSIALPGFLKVCLFGTGCGDANSNLTVPLTPIGAGGSAFVTAAANLTVVGAPWTTETAAIGSFTRMGSAQGPGAGTSSTAQSGGVVQLVTPIRIFGSSGIGEPLPSFATLTLRFVPEPATFTLLALGIAGLAGAGRRS